MVVLQVIIFSATPSGLLKALLLKGEPSRALNNLPAVLFWGEFVVSKLHCKLNFMSTFVSEGNTNRVTNCQVLILKINMSYLHINVFTNFSHDLFFISERNLEREKIK